MAEYEISRTTGRCSISGRPLREDEEFYTAVIEGEAGIERRDYSLEAWQGPPAEALCFFKTRLPKKDEPKRTFVSDDVLVEFFLRLANAEDAAKQRFRFVLSLILLRKRLLKYERTVRDANGESLELRLMRDKTMHLVRDPALDESEIEELTGELSAILHGHVAQIETADPVSDSSDANVEAVVTAHPHGDDSH